MKLEEVFSYIKKTYSENNADFWLSGLRAFIGVVWIFSGIEKIISPAYFTNFAKTVGYFASKNPNGFFVNFLTGTVAPNATLFSYLVAYGELLVGLGLLFGLLTNTSALVGIFMNIIFYFGAGWTGISTAMLNVQMVVLQIIVLLAPGSKTLSLEYFFGLLKLRKEYVGAEPKKPARAKKNLVKF